MTDETTTTPSAVVHGQTDAYNDGDAKAFAEYFAEGAVVSRLEDGERIATGREAIREQYGALFDAVPDLHCVVTDEFVVDSFVACREHVTGIDDPTTALALYRVADGHIQQLWLGGEQ